MCFRVRYVLLYLSFHCQKRGSVTAAVTLPISLFVFGWAVGWRLGLGGASVLDFQHGGFGGSMEVRVVFERDPGTKTTGIVMRRWAPPLRRAVFGLRCSDGHQTANIVTLP